MKFKMAPQNGGKMIFGKKFTEITLSRTVCEINAFLPFTQNSRWPPKMAGEQFLEKIAT